jgi:tetratricopeptide (TPR) repeat protein
MIQPIRVPGILVLIILIAIPVMSAEVTRVKLDNRAAIELYNKAVDETAAGRFLEAINLTEQALAIQPNFTLAWVTRTGALLELGRIEEAKISLDAARVLEPDDTSVLTASASYNLQIRDYKTAIKDADKALSKDPGLIEAWIIKGTAHGELGEYQEEIHASTQALLIAPENRLVQSNLQYASEMMKKNKKTPLFVSTIFIALIGGFLLLCVDEKYHDQMRED